MKRSVGVFREGIFVVYTRNSEKSTDIFEASSRMDVHDSQNATAVFGGGCFWCTEAVFSSLRGVHAVTPGYAGGILSDPSYEQVATGTTGHAEVVRVLFDPRQITYHDLLDVFFSSHDPTTLNRQGSDIGTPYRSIIFYVYEHQRREASSFLKKLNASLPKEKQAVTALKPLETFYPAETYHEHYYQKNTQASYCRFVIQPKLQKLRKDHAKIVQS